MNAQKLTKAIVLFLLSTATAFAQNNIQIKGTVVDSNGERIAGANILEKGTTNGVISGFDGDFTIQAGSNSTLVVSFLGFVTQEIPVNGRSSLAVTLSEDRRLLDEVVVVGYGIQKKVDVIGSISSVDSSTLEARSVADVTNMLTGHMSGVTITQTSGNPGDDAGTIRIRGVGSFGATPDPLVLIDGIPGSLSDLTPSEIDNISVLKDAASAAIYGSRAANGVILVTTKKGEKGNARVTYNAAFSMNQALTIPEMAHSYEYAEYMNLATGTQSYTQEMIQKYRDGSDPDNYADEMYLEELIGGHAFQTKHEVTVSGGTDKVQYMAALGYLYQDGLLNNNYYNRYNARVNLNAELAKNLFLTLRVNGTVSDRHEPSTPGILDTERAGGIIHQGLRFPGLTPSYLSNGEVGLGPKFQGTPVAWADCASFYSRNRDKFEGNLELSYTPVKGLTLRVIGGYNYMLDHIRHYRADMTLTGGASTGPSSLTDEMDRTAYKTFQGIAQYSATFGGKHNFSILAGYTWEDESQRTVSGSRLNFPSDDVLYLGAGDANGQTNDGGGYDWAIQSVFARVTYNYDERYLFEATARYDGSSRFPTSSRYGFFPSVAVGWRMSEEKFWKDNPGFASTFSYMKIKASYGILGNNNIGNYPYQSVFTLSDSLNYVFGGVITQGAAVTTYVDPTLKWERTRTSDIGIETGFFENKLTFNAAYFYRKTKDILYQPSASYSDIFGLSISQVNTGELQNQGWEFEIGYHNHAGDFYYSIDGNLSLIHNKVLTLGMGNVTQGSGMVGNGSDLFIGYPMNTFYGYKTDGVFLTDDEVSEWYDQSAIAPGSQAGDLRYVDLNGDGVVNTDDQTFLGSSIPKLTYGLNISLEYKGFDLGILLQGVGGVSGRLVNQAGYAFYNESSIQKWQMEECWNVQQDNRYPGYPRLEILANSGSNNTLLSDFWIRSAWFLKVRNIQLGYSLPATATRKFGASGLRFYVSFDNPFFFSSYPKGWDPETTSNNGNYYPTMSTYTFGFTLKF